MSKSVKEKVLKYYESFFSVPQYVGAIDGTQIEIKQPSVDSLDYNIYY